MFDSDADTFKDLDAFLVAFLDLHVDFQSVARLESRYIGPQLLSFDHIEYVHKCLTLVNPVCFFPSSDGRLRHATSGQPHDLRRSGLPAPTSHETLPAACSVDAPLSAPALPDPKTNPSKSTLLCPPHRGHNALLHQR